MAPWAATACSATTKAAAHPHEVAVLCAKEAGSAPGPVHMQPDPMPQADCSDRLKGVKGSQDRGASCCAYKEWNLHTACTQN